jgi:hypothetical protein
MWLYVRVTLVLLLLVCIATGVALGFVVIGRYHCHMPVPARSNAWSLAGHNARTRGIGKGTAATALLLGLLLIGALPPKCSATPRLRPYTRAHTRTPHARTNVGPIASPASSGARALARFAHCSPTYLISHGIFGVVLWVPSLPSLRPCFRRMRICCSTLEINHVHPDQGVYAQVRELC